VASYSVAASGMMIFQTGASNTERLLQWVDLTGEGSGAIGTPGQLFRPRVSPDGTRCMVEVVGESEEGIDLWLVDLEAGLRTRFTFEAGDEVAPCWTPDGESVVYVSRNEGLNRIVKQPVEGLGGASVLFEWESQLATDAVNPEGTAVLFTREGEGGDFDMMQLSLEGEGEPSSVRATPDPEGGGRFSPDGRWIAYHGRSASTWDVFVMPAEGGPRKWQVTTHGAVWPQWSPDGSELLVSNFNGSILAYDVQTRGESFHVGSSRQVATAEAPSADGAVYSIHPDGERILRAGPDPTSQSFVSMIHLVTDWRRGLAR
jgi:Tol biopolymer transport system component